MFCLMFNSLNALALDANRMPDINDQAKELTVYFYVQKMGVDTPISGAEIAIYKIADLDVIGGSANYTVVEQYQTLQKKEHGIDVTFNGLRGSDVTQVASDFNAIVKTADQTGVTNDQGICVFSNLEQGMYLVKEISATQDALKYEFFAPYIISVPLADTLGNENQWLYKVLSEPKTVVKEKEESSTPESSIPDQPDNPDHPDDPGRPIITGESSWIWLIAGIWGISMIVIGISIRKKHHNM